MSEKLNLVILRIRKFGCEKNPKGIYDFLIMTKTIYSIQWWMQK